MGEEKKTRYHAIEDWMLKDPFFNAGARFKIYIIIRRYTLAGKIGKCVYSLSDFEDSTGLRRPVICRSLQELKDNGYISIEKDGQRNYYTSIEKINKTSNKSLLVTNSDYSGEIASHKKLLDQSQKVTRLVTKSDQHPNYDLTKIKLINNKAVNICLLDNTPSENTAEMGTETDTDTAHGNTAITATADGMNGNNGNVENPSLSFTETATAQGNTADESETDTAQPHEGNGEESARKDDAVLDRLLAERPLEEIVTEKLMALYPPSKVDISNDEVIFRLRNIQNLEAETVYLLTLVKETMDINPAYVPKLSRYLDQGNYLQHYRVRCPLDQFEGQTLRKADKYAHMTDDDWKEASDFLLKEFGDMGGGFQDPLPEPSEREKAEALAWLESLGQKKTGGAKQ